MQQYLAKSSGLNDKTIQILNEQNVAPLPFDPAQFKVRMYFDSSCPHCKKMFQTLASLQQAGVYVEAFQTDDRLLKKASYPVPIQKASKEDIKTHNISAVPFTLVADLKKKALYPPVRGYKSLSEMMMLLKKGDVQ